MQSLLNGLVVCNSRTTKGAEVSSLFSHTNSSSQVINVSINLSYNTTLCSDGSDRSFGFNSSFEKLQDSLKGLVIGNSRTSEGSKISRVLSNTRQSSHIINVGLVSVDQVGKGGAQ